MSRPRKIGDEFKLRIALMSSEGGMTNRQIAEELDISESAVSKALKESFEQGRVRVVFNREGLTEKQLAALRSSAAGANELKRSLAAMPKDSRAVVTEPDVRIFDTENVETTPAAWTARLDRFGKDAAPYILSLVMQSRLVGTSWGETLAALVRGLPERSVERPKLPIQFVPLCGEMLEGPPRKASASNLAYKLDEIVNGDRTHSHSYWLAGVPSHRPSPKLGTQGQLTADECKAVARYIHQLPAYRKIFGPDPRRKAERNQKTPLIDRLDMILTSCGPKERPLGYSGVKDLRSLGLSLREARKLLVGDVSGILLRNPALPGKRPTHVDDINDAWAGAKLSHLRECAARAAANSCAGTVLCCIGANKADTVLEIVRLGLASRIAMDLDLSQALRRKL